MNKVILIGNLTRDPETTKTPNDVSICKFSIAVNRDYSDNEGNRETDYFNIVVWRGKAENCGKYLKKGSKVGVVGRLQNRSYEDNEGTKRTITEIVADDVEFLTPKQAEDPQETVVSTNRERPALTPINDNKLPF
jgi:single-strand DNA-binding protein